MSSRHYALEFEDEAVRQIMERGYAVADVFGCLGALIHSLCNEGCHQS